MENLRGRRSTHSNYMHRFICVMWLTFICVMRPLHMCDMTPSYVSHSYVCHDSFLCVPWLIPMCAMTHSYVWHDSFMCVTWLLHTYEITPVCPCVTNLKGAGDHSKTCESQKKEENLNIKKKTKKVSDKAREYSQQKCEHWRHFAVRDIPDQPLGGKKEKEWVWREKRRWRERVE